METEADNWRTEAVFPVELADTNPPIPTRWHPLFVPRTPARCFTTTIIIIIITEQQLKHNNIIITIRMRERPDRLLHLNWQR